MNLIRGRRQFLSLVVVTTLSGVGAACGVKGPLYLPDETETETETETDKKKDKDKEKTSQRKSPGDNPTLA